MISKNCKGCGTRIYLASVNNLWKAFNNENLTEVHNCEPYRRLKNSHSDNQDDHALLTRTISRVSELERKYKELSKKAEYKIDP